VGAYRRGHAEPGADILRDDRITSIKDRRDQVVFDGPLIVDAIAERIIGGSVSHKVIQLRRHRG
jgi:hypothetical protein